MTTPVLGLSGRIARAFQDSQLTPLLAVVGFLLGLFAVAVTPKEEEPQIDVTFANVLIPFPGAAPQEVEQLVAIPAEQVLSGIEGVEHVFSMSRPDGALLTVQFEVGVPRQEALVRLYNQVYSHQDWLPADLGTLPPLIKPKGIDDVPIVALTLWSEDPAVTALDLRRIAHSLETELKRIPGTRDLYTLGAPEDAVRVELDPAALATHGLDSASVTASLQQALVRSPGFSVTHADRQPVVRIGDAPAREQEIANLVIGLAEGQPVYLRDIARIRRDAPPLTSAVRHAGADGQPPRPALTLAITKQPGRNAVDVARAVIQRVESLRNVLLPSTVEVTVTRDYGQTAAEKSSKLILKLVFATAAVVLLVLLALGWREALIVGLAIVVTLAITLFASWAWGFTLNRVSLFALIFSIGILVDDAIVVVENIHRHHQASGKPLLAVIPGAVDEVGGATILATLTVIAALMPMAFVSGLMGPYMSPIPINASMGMLISLAVAFVITPWLAARLMRAHPHPAGVPHAAGSASADSDGWMARSAGRAVAFFVDLRSGRRRRALLMLACLLLVAVALVLPVFKLVVLKMLPFDNKSEFQVVVDLPEGTPVERTLQVLEALSDPLRAIPEVSSLQWYAGTAAPINFNGLVRQYDLRQQPHLGDIQVNLVDKHQRERSSHAIAQAVRAPLQAIAQTHGATVSVVEVPPGPPVLAPLVAEIHGYDAAQRTQVAAQVRAVLEDIEGLVDIDDSLEHPVERLTFQVDRQRAAEWGIPYDHLISALALPGRGSVAGYLRGDDSKYAVPVMLVLADGDKATPERLLALPVTALDGRRYTLADLVTVQSGFEETTIHRKDLLPVIYVTADMAGSLDSPLYGMFEAVARLEDAGIDQHFIEAPSLDAQPSLKWDGEWQVTYETFRDMGLAYGVGMILIYLLVVAQFRSYGVPLIIMAPIALTLIGVMPGHALLGAQFTATSMIGMIALAGIIVRNSILLVDFANEQLAAGLPLPEAIIRSSAVRAKPILLTALAAVLGALFILDDPIFNGLAVSLVFGILVSSVLTLVVIPVLYYQWLSCRSR